MDVLWDAETAPIEWLQGLADWPVLPLTAVTGLGAQAVVIPLLALVFWCVSPGLGGRLLVLAISSSVVNHLLKLFVHGSRPSWYSAQIAQHTSESSFGMPSGHAQGATAVLGYAGIRSGRRGLLWAALALAALICFSRVYLGAHFISDVVVGVLLGALILWAFLRWEDRVLAWWRGLPTARWASLAVAAALVPCVLAALWRYTARGDWTVPAEWIGAVPPDPAGYTLSGVYSTSGALLAVLVVAVPRLAGAGHAVPEDWQVAACDVGQGDSLAVRTGPSSAVVVDVGPDGEAAGRCLDRLGVTTVDLLVLSHFHADHVGGLAAVLRGRTVVSALVSPLDEPAGAPSVQPAPRPRSEVPPSAPVPSAPAPAAPAAPSATVAAPPARETPRQAAERRVREAQQSEGRSSGRSSWAPASGGNPADDEPSADDPDITSTGMVGVQLVVQVLDGKVIEEIAEQP